jgi:hypothetical protein
MTSKRASLVATLLLSALLFTIAGLFNQQPPAAQGQTAGPVMVGEVSDAIVLVSGRYVLFTPKSQPTLVLSIDDARALSAYLAEAASTAEANPWGLRNFFTALSPRF